MRRERFELADGDFVDLDWSPRRSGPVVLILHGLEGCSGSSYARGLLAAVHRAGWRGAVVHFRGCSGEPNRLDRTYHSGDTGDIAVVVDRLLARDSAVPILAVGYSLGGNVLLKWLGELRAETPLQAAVAVSVPFALDIAAARLECGLSRLYQAYLLRFMRRKIRNKFARHPVPPVDLRNSRGWRTMRAFDDAVTAPLHGFLDAEDYYRRASSRDYLATIATPTLILQALDDPFMGAAVIPHPRQLSPSITLELSDHGGHVGFIGGRSRGEADYWLDRRIPDFLRRFVD